MPLTSLRLITLCYSNALKTCRVEQLRCDQETSAGIAFFKFVTERWCKRYNVIPMRIFALKLGQKKQPNVPYVIYFRKDFFSGASHRSSVMKEVFISWNNAHKSHVFTYQAWSMNSSDQTKRCAQDNLSKACKRHSKSSGSLEQESGLIDAIALDFLNKIYLKSEVFNFSGFRLVQAAKNQCDSIDTLSLLKSSIGRFYSSVQEW